jgi:RNA polymerase sigma-70 factor (ECF subfamily)
MGDLDRHLPGIVAGDPEAFARWLAGAEPRLRAGLRPFASQVDVEAVLQESLLRVWQVAPLFAPDGRPDGLLRLSARIARNLALDEVRRARRSEPPDPDAEECVSHSGGEPDPLLRRVIEECRRRLRGKPALAFAARLERGASEPDEVLARRLGMTLNTFLQNFTRARRALAECLESHGVDLDGVVR